MAPAIDDDWSDSDDEIESGVETQVLLGVPDGPIDTPADLRDAAVSRIGGLPVRVISLSACTFIPNTEFTLCPRCFCLQSHRRLLLPNARTARSLWNCSSKYGAR